MANCTDFKSKMVEILKEANESYQNSIRIIVENKKYLSNMYDDLSSSYDNLCRQTNENLDVVEIILASGGDPLGTSKVLETLKSSFNLPSSHKFLEEMMVTKQKQLTEAQQVLKLFLHEKREDILRIRSLLQGISPLPSVVKENSQHPEPTYDDKFDPKLGSSGVLSDETNVAHPCDQDSALYHQMQMDLQEELSSATNQSSSYCPNLAAGKAYALQLGQIWHRVLVEKRRTLIAVFVDTGVRKEIQPTMEFHFLPSRFMQLKAQSVKIDAENELIFNAAVDNELKQEEEVVPPVEMLFKPKFGPLEGASRCFRPSAVLITRVIYPNHLYVQFLDKDIPLYRQMNEDLQQEFRWSTKQSTSYCSSPVVGQAYAIKSEKAWHRVIVEQVFSRNLSIFFVDTGRCTGVRPFFEFHALPERFMEVKAQAVKCTLYGITAPLRENEDVIAGLYPKGAYGMLRKYVGTRAVAVIKGLKAGKVGSAHKTDIVKELTAVVILYADGAEESINREIGQSELARFIKNREIDVPEHQEIRRKALLEAEQWALPASSTSIVQEDEAELKTGDDSGLVLLPVETVDELEMDIDPAKPLVEEKDHIVLPVTFIGARSPEALFFRTDELADKFIKIQNALYNYFGGHHSGSAIDYESVSCVVGFVCAVQSDGRWYRAEVVENENHPDIVVSLLDKDLFVMVHAGEIRRLPEELTDIPRTVLRCSLSGIYPASGSLGWSHEVTQHITERLKGAEQVTIRNQKIADDVHAGSSFPVCVYIKEKQPSDMITAGLVSTTSLKEELVYLGMASSSISDYIVETTSTRTLLGQRK